MRSARYGSALAALLLFLARAYPALAQTPVCDALPTDKKALAQDLFAALHPYDGCDETFMQCFSAKPIKPIVSRLASDVCRQVKMGRGRQEISHALSRRAQSMLPLGRRAVLTLDEATRAGSAAAPVAVVVYACARCPFCKVLVPALYSAVADGPLKGKVRLYFRPFPLKDHPGSIEGGLAMVSAAKLGRFWPFTLELYKRYDSFCPGLLLDWAQATGMDRAAFERELADAKNREALVASKQEGLRNRVNATPTIFIDGREYVYELTLDVIADVLDEAYEARR